ncbi:VOC family protein [Spiractinospora alimapuensis]|uniref:VOC family protein n=1 Tax=Spiractinospora alimapuensis TaxID=2820884 RepID=UPI001F377BF9|nr:VOC family protein [Spiractinospora alimapuensis]QVQ52705.1 VOC family protein [Spiractinospora alimapuensis]
MTPHEPPTNPVAQLRLVVETEDFDAALAFYRDALGLAEKAAFQNEGDARVSILDAGHATLELVNPAQRAFIDQVEVGRPASPTIRVAFQVPDAETATRTLVEAGADLVAPPTVTPWRSRNARLNAPAGLQLTLFEELETEEERIQRMGFGTTEDRTNG